MCTSLSMRRSLGNTETNIGIDAERKMPMTRTADRDFDWIAMFAYFSGVAVILMSLAALAANLFAVFSSLV